MNTFSTFHLSRDPSEFLRIPAFLLLCRQTTKPEKSQNPLTVPVKPAVMNDQSLYDKHALLNALPIDEHTVYQSQGSLNPAPNSEVTTQFAEAQDILGQHLAKSSPITISNPFGMHKSAFDDQSPSTDDTTQDSETASPNIQDSITIKLLKKKPTPKLLSEEDIRNLLLRGQSNLTKSSPVLPSESEESPIKKVRLSSKKSTNCEEIGLKEIQMTEIDIETEQYINGFNKLEKKCLPAGIMTKLTGRKSVPWRLLQRVIVHIKDVMILLQDSRHDYLEKILDAEGVLQARTPGRSEFRRFLENFDKEEGTYKYIKTVVSREARYGKVLVSCVDAFLSIEGEIDFNIWAREVARLGGKELEILGINKEFFRTKFRNTVA